MNTVTFNFIDICTPCYLTDSHHRTNECLVAIPFDTQAISDKQTFAEEVASEAMAYCESLWEHLPEDDDEALELLTHAVLDEIQGMTLDIDTSENEDEDDMVEDVMFYGYFSWTVEPAVESVAIELDDASFRSYLETALWSSSDDDGDPLDMDFGTDDFDSDQWDSQRRQCEEFIRNNCVAIAAVMAEGIPLPQIMHDLWLTRNHHGAGFWDGDYPEPYATLLTASAQKFGEVDVYIGDDEILYFS